ncbi:MAG: DUF4375 domain-containing protein [Pyrinomonadaceae bacterium]|nr:DUF4375 domain-containing protein [Acidobacteriota bacterium]MBK7934037.1 DUF4375 domain-containing protein [Acidobacteriota bacterium]MBP7375812.1 DUF4375 domain-containing protein [Pyrinomonadaceae bacterium]
MILRSITNQQLAEDPNLLWNNFIDLLAIEDFDVLTAEQRPAHLVFWYESEVENGGHLQYFENWGTERLPETIQALELFGAECQMKILIEAGKQWTSIYRNHPETVEEFVATALEGDLEEFDRQFHKCKISLNSLLEAHLLQFSDNFVQLS